MTKKDLEGVREGDVVRHVGSGDSYVVERGYDRRTEAAIGVRTIEISNPSEWSLVSRVGLATTPELLAELERRGALPQRTFTVAVRRNGELAVEYK